MDEMAENEEKKEKKEKKSKRGRKRGSKGDVKEVRIGAISSSWDLQSNRDVIDENEIEESSKEDEFSSSSTPLDAPPSSSSSLSLVDAAPPTVVAPDGFETVTYEEILETFKRYGRRINRLLTDYCSFREHPLRKLMGRWRFSLQLIAKVIFDLCNKKCKIIGTARWLDRHSRWWFEWISSIERIGRIWDETTRIESKNGEVSSDW